MKLFSKCIVAALCIGGPMAFTACNDDDNTFVDVDGLAPEMNLSETEAWIEAGRDLVVKGNLKDADGIASVRLLCHNLLVDKTIDLLAINDGVAPTEYQLSYKIQTKYNIPEADDYSLTVTVTDVGGRETQSVIPVRLDADITAPVFTSKPDPEMAVLVKEGVNTTFDLEFSISDNLVIDYVNIDLEERITIVEPNDRLGIEGQYEFQSLTGYPKKIDVNEKTYVYSEPVTFNDDKTRVLRATITTCDKEKNEAAHFTEVSSIITLTPLTENFKLYLCDVEDVTDLSKDVFGVPMLVDNVAPFTYEARYYNEKAGTGVFFVGQKGNFGPICFGPLKTDKNTFGDEYKYVDRITLDQEGVYYLIKFNTLDRTYNVSTYTIEEAIDPIMHMHYGEDDMNTWWEINNMDDIWWQRFVIGPAGDPAGVEGNEMEQDTKNKHIYIKDNWTIMAGDLHFAIQAWHSHGWWNFESWRVDNSSDPDKFMYYGNYHPETPHYESNDDYFEWKYPAATNPEYMEYVYPKHPDFDLNSWSSEDYRKNFVPDNWVNVKVPETGKYKLIFDAHLERARLVPKD